MFTISAIKRRLTVITLFSIAIVLFGSSPAITHAEEALTITNFLYPNDVPSIIAQGQDGNVWFTAQYNIGRITPSGATSSFPTNFYETQGNMVTGPDGNLWFVGYWNDKVYRLTTSGVVTEFPFPSSTITSGVIAVGYDGNLWLGIEPTEGEYWSSDGHIIRMSPNGTVIDEFSLASGDQYGIATDLVLGPDGNMWFTEVYGRQWGASIGRITPDGVITRFPLASWSNPRSITTGPDGNLWFTEYGIYGTYKIGRITPEGVITEFPLLTIQALRITSGPDGNLWFVGNGGPKIGRITPIGEITEFPLNGPGPATDVVAGSDGNVWFTSYYNGVGTVGRVNLATSTPSGKTPVLFIPGLMGTNMSKNSSLLWLDPLHMFESIGDNFMDPLASNLDGTPSDGGVKIENVVTDASLFGRRLDYTTGLTNELVLNRGYSTSTNSTSSIFALFPYDWRKDITSVANNELRVRIDTLLSQTGSQKIDIIAHSQGGLVIKKLLLDHPEYKSKIRKLIFIGTPHLGAPKAAKGLLYGDDYGIGVSVGDRRISFLDPEETKYIAHNMPSGYELLPSTQYFSTMGGYLKSGGISYETPSATTQKLKALGLNSTLLDTKTASFHNNLDLYDFTGSGIDVTNIVGCNQPSVAQIKLGTNHDSSLLYTAGDGTVPIASAEAVLGATRTLFVTYPDTDHSKMPSFNGIRQTIADIITGTSTVHDSHITESPISCDLSGRMFSAHSPVALNIYDAAGNHLGPTDDGGFEANIPGSSYDTLGDEKFAFVPEGNYTVKLDATDAGHFSFFSSKIADNETVSTASYLDIPITSTSKAEIITNDANTQTIALDTTGQGTATTTVTPTAVLTGSSTDDVTPPVTTLIATGTKSGSWYTSNVTITFSAADTTSTSSGQAATGTPSGLLKTEYAFDNSTSTIWQTYSTSTLLVATTTTTLYYYSTDKIGNKEAVASTTITIAPPTTYHLDMGATTTYTDTMGNLWQPDQYFTGGTAVNRGAIAIANTNDDRLYQTERYGMTSYNIPLANGTYQVTLHFAETSPSVTATGQRTFNVSLEGATILTNLDVFKEAGKNTALIKTFTKSVTDGTLNLTFTKVVNAPEINAIAITPADTTPPTTPTNLTAIAVSSTQINLTWATSTDNVKVAGYKLERCTGATCTTFVQIATTTSPQYNNTALTASTTYRFRVRAYDTSGNNSAYSTITTITTPKAPQTIFQDTFESALNWTKAGAVTWYTGAPKVGTHAVKLTTTASIEKAISLTNYQNITVSFRMGANSLDTSSENVQALYYNGTAWITLTTIANNSTNENNQLNPYTFTLPSTMNNKSTFKLRFKINGSATDDAAFIDEVKVGGVGR